MSHISANDLKTKGIAAIELALSTAPGKVAAAVPHARCVCHVADLSQLPSLSSVWSAVVAAVDGGGGSGARRCWQWGSSARRCSTAMA